MDPSDMVWLANMKDMAKIIKGTFDALVAEGFTAAEALELCKAILTPPGGKIK